MDVDWSLINKAKNLIEEQIPEPILKIPSVPDYRDLPCLSCDLAYAAAVLAISRAAQAAKPGFRARHYCGGGKRVNG